MMVFIRIEISTFIPVSKEKIETITKINNGNIERKICLSKKFRTGPKIYPKHTSQIISGIFVFV